MNYKMIVLDLDDTLLLPNGTISLKTKDILIEAQEKGIKVVLASGRPEYAIHKIAEELELSKYGSYILSFNGGKIIDCRTKEVLYQASLNKAQMENLYDLAIKHDCFIHTYDGDNILTCHDNPYTYIESEITGMPIKMCEDFVKALPDECIKAILLQTPKHLKEAKELLKTVVKDMCMTISKPFFLEFMNKDVDKGKTILRLCDIINISKEEVMAIGDSYNDISMLEAVGFSIAMGNAVDEIKEIADFITDSNIEDGVYKAVKKFAL